MCRAEEISGQASNWIYQKVIGNFLEKGSKEETAFTFGFYDFGIMPFDLPNAPTTFQKTINHILRGSAQFILMMWSKLGFTVSPAS